MINRICPHCNNTVSYKDTERNIVIEFLDRSHWRTDADRSYHDKRVNAIVAKTDAIFIEVDPEADEVNRYN